MTVIARFEVTPVGNDSMTEEIAQALEAIDDFDVSYELTPTATVIESDEVAEVYEAAAAAHEAIQGERTLVELEVDDQGGRERRGQDRIDAVEEELGRPPEG